jgi:hypothetical protein
MTRVAHRARPASIALVVLLCVAACVATPGAPTWPVSPEVLPSATSAIGDAQLTCGGRAFLAAGLAASPGAEKAAGPEFDALRAALAKFGAEFPGSAGLTWRLAGRDPSGAIFVARTDALGSPGWVSIELDVGTDGWQPRNMGSCDPNVVLSAEFGPATWALDPAFPAPVPGSTELHVLVWEQACSSSSPATGRMSAPIVEYGATTVTMTIGVRPRGGVQTCPGPPGTPALVELSEPLGSRTLLDGGHVPPAPPTPG